MSRAGVYTDAYTNEAVREIENLFAARDFVRPYVGTLDMTNRQCPAGIYIAAIEALGHDARGIAAGEARDLFHSLKNQGRTHG